MQMKFDGDGCERFIQALLALKADDKVEGALSELKPTVTTDLWDSLARQQVNKLVTTQSYQKGDIILEQGQFYSIVVLVFRGLIRLERTLSSGETVYLYSDCSGVEIFGDSGFFLCEPSSFTLRAESDVEVLLVRGSFLCCDFISYHPSLVAPFYYHFCHCIAERSARQLDQLQ